MSQRVLLCVPAYGGTVRVETMRTVALGLVHLQKTLPGITLELHTLDLAEIARARNLFASKALATKADVMLMIDADMGFDVRVLSTLLQSGHDLCGLVYAKRKIDLAKVHAAAVAGKSLREATVAGLDFAMGTAFVATEGRITADKGFVEMRMIPAGCMAVRRHVLETMWEKLPELRQAHPGDAERAAGLTQVLRCFDNTSDEEGRALSEDASFCHRWRSLGGKVHALVEPSVTHVGTMAYEASYGEWIKQVLEKKPPSGGAAAADKSRKGR